MKVPSAKYIDWRQNIQTGDILACMGKSKMSKGIQWTEHKQDKEPLCFQIDQKTIKGFLSHVGIFIRIGRHVFILEADGKLVQPPRRFSRIYKDYNGYLFIIRPCIAWSGLSFAENALDVEGNKYDWKGIWTQLINCFRKEIIKHKENEQLFCSELLNMASGYYWESKDEWCTPHDIALKERNNFLVRITDV